MKTTVKTEFGGSAIVQPLKRQQMIMITVRDAGPAGQGQTIFVEMTPDQAGALMFGMEQALAAIGCEVNA